MRKTISYLSACIMALMLSSCATIMSENEYSVSIQSEPSGAEYAIVNRAGATIKQGITPDKVSLKSSAGFFKGEKYKITFSKAGYATQVYELKSTVSGWYIGGNLVFGGFLGWLVIDPATGKMFNLPEVAAVKLVPNGGFADDNRHALRVKTLDQLSDEEIMNLQPINLK